MPYIFILCLNLLSLSLDLTLHTKQWKPIRVGRRPIDFNHILFAEDVFLFAHANVNVCNVLFNIFSQFCQLFGQICSSSKSKLFFSSNTPTDIQSQIASQVEMPIVTNLGKYLGMPLLTKRNTTSDFQPILDKVQNQVRVWQSKLISQAGRLNLIKYVLAPLTYYPMQTTILPRGITTKMDQVIRGFL